jgi:epoxyqueuosine reductase
VDATPLSESFYAEKAGLGFRGKNSLLINPDFGSWFVLGEIMTTLCCHETFFLINSLKQAKQISLTTKTGCPAGCQRCLKACPTGALYAPYKMDASRCLSYLTIEYKQELVPQSWPNLKNWLFGCDICQAVCPFNRHPLLTTEKDFLHHKSGSLLNLSWILSIKNDEEYKTLFAGSPLMRAGRGRLLRNALIVAANTRVNAVKQLIRPLCSDNEPLIAKHAVQAYALLTS